MAPKFAMDVPNFVNQRQVAQALASHANLSVLDGQGDVAVQDLLMMRRVSDLSGSSPTLVGAMIRIAIVNEKGKVLMPQELTTAAELRAAASQATALKNECERLATLK